MPREPRERLMAAAAWMSLGGRDAGELTDAAADALVAGIDSPRLRELAGLHRRTEWPEVRDVAIAAFEEIGLTFPDWRSEEGKLAALAELCLRYRSRELTARDLTGWAYSHIGFDGAPEAQEIVELGDALDDFAHGWGGWRRYDREGALLLVEAAVERFLAR